MFAAFVIARCLKEFGVNGVFVFISGAMIVVIRAIAILGPKTRNVATQHFAKS